MTQFKSGQMFSIESHQKDIPMRNKHMKTCSISYIITELQVKTTRYYYTLIRMTKIQNTDNTKCWWICETTGILSHSLLTGMQHGIATLKDSLAVSYKTKHTLAIQSSSSAPCYLCK